MRKAIFAPILASTITLSVSNLSVAQRTQNDPMNLSSNAGINQLINAGFAYTGVALACEYGRYWDLKRKLVRLINLENSRNRLLAEGKYLQKNLTLYIEDGAKKFSSRPYITCSEAEKYYPIIMDSIDSLLSNER